MKKKLDLNQLAKSIVEQATGEVEKKQPRTRKKSCGGLTTVLSKRVEYQLEDAESVEELESIKRRITIVRLTVLVIFLAVFGWVLSKDLSGRGHGLTMDKAMPALGMVFFGGGLFILAQYFTNQQAIIDKMATAGLNYSAGKIKLLGVGSVVAGLAFGVSCLNNLFVIAWR